MKNNRQKLEGDSQNLQINSIEHIQNMNYFESQSNENFVYIEESLVIKKLKNF